VLLRYKISIEELLRDLPLLLSLLFIVVVRGRIGAILLYRHPKHIPLHTWSSSNSGSGGSSRRHGFQLLFLPLRLINRCICRFLLKDGMMVGHAIWSSTSAASGSSYETAPLHGSAAGFVERVQVLVGRQELLIVTLVAGCEEFFGVGGHAQPPTLQFLLKAGREVHWMARRMSSDGVEVWIEAAIAGETIVETWADAPFAAIMRGSFIVPTKGSCRRLPIV